MTRFRQILPLLLVALTVCLGCAPVDAAPKIAKIAPTPAAPPIHIIPQPDSITSIKAVFTFTPKAYIVTDKDLEPTAILLATELRKATGYAWRVRPASKFADTRGRVNTCAIHLQRSRPTNRKAIKGSYLLAVNYSHVVVRSADAAGAFYATRTLLQLLPPAVFKNAKHNKNVKWTIPCCTIKDSPRFQWRGYMIDDSRHFYGVEKIKRYLDLMALHKLNVFHWHLTDDQGWRIEIKGYPKLTTVGAQRGEGLPLPRQTRRTSDPAVYGGFYTQEQIKEIVAYAAARHINIMPEIDVPGHSKAVGAAYPETICKIAGDTKSVQGFKGNVWCAAREGNFKMLDEIVKQCAELFPFGYMHIGGDEVNKKQWAACPRCKKLIADKLLKNTSGVQNYFIRRMETIVRKHKMKMMGWNEILHGGKLAPDTIIQSWIGVGPGIHAAKLGHQVVMSPGPYLYFDMAEAPGERGHWWAGIVTVKDTYGYDPTDDAGIPASAKSKFMGIEAALWGEFLDTPNEPDYKTFPRLCALSEAAWTQPAKKGYAKFLGRLGTHFVRLDALGVHYRIPRPEAFRDGDQIEIVPPFPGCDVRYTTDGTAPAATSPRYTKPFTLRPGQKLQMISLAPNGRICRKPVTAVRPKPVAQWTPALPSAGNDAWLIPVKINSAGTWAVRFIHREKGGRSLNIKGVQLLDTNTKVVASDMRPINIEKKIKRADYQLKVPAAGNYTLAVTLSARQITTYGDVIVERVDRLSPKTTIATTLPSYGKNTAAKAVDYNQGTFFWVSRHQKKGDTITFVFDTPQTLTRIESRTGQPNGTKDQLLHGKFEYSTDGKTFTGAKDYTFGTAVLKFAKPTKVKAVRLGVTADNSEAWLIVQDLLLR